VKDSDAGVDGLWGANSVAISPEGSHVYVASRHDDALAVFDRDGTSGALTYRGTVQDIDAGVDGLWGARALVVSPNGDYVYVVSQYDNALACFSRNPTSGTLTFVQVVKDTDPGVDGLDVADGVAISPSGGHIYVAGYDDDAVAVFAHPFAIYLPLIIRD
jgi:6-phosphogluconolactonase (cycloisomerase 2 family)